MFNNLFVFNVYSVYITFFLFYTYIYFTIGREILQLNVECLRAVRDISGAEEHQGQGVTYPGVVLQGCDGKKLVEQAQVRKKTFHVTFFIRVSSEQGGFRRIALLGNNFLGISHLLHQFQINDLKFCLKLFIYFIISAFYHLQNDKKLFTHIYFSNDTNILL